MRLRLRALARYYANEVVCKQLQSIRETYKDIPYDAGILAKRPTVHLERQERGRELGVEVDLYVLRPPESMLDLPEAHHVPGPLPSATRPADDHCKSRETIRSNGFYNVQQSTKPKLLWVSTRHHMCALCRILRNPNFWVSARHRVGSASMYMQHVNPLAGSGPAEAASLLWCVIFVHSVIDVIVMNRMRQCMLLNKGL